MAELKVTTKGERAARAKPVASMSVKLSDLVAIKACDVGMSDLAVGPSRAAGDSFTDAGISRGERFERELVAKPLDLIRGQSRVAVDVFVGLWMTV